MPTSEDVERLPLFNEANAIGIFLERDDQIMLKYTIVAMVASKTSGKSTYALGCDFLTMRMATKVATWCRPLWQTRSPCMYCQVA